MSTAVLGADVLYYPGLILLAVFCEQTDLLAVCIGTLDHLIGGVKVIYRDELFVILIVMLHAVLIHIPFVEGLLLCSVSCKCKAGLLANRDDPSPCFFSYTLKAS